MDAEIPAHAVGVNRERLFMRHVVNLVPAALLVLLVAACDPSTTPESPGASPQAVAVTVEPPAVGVEQGKTVAFAANVTGSADTTVAWTVVEVGGGTVNASGLYTAPATSGTFHVRATSRADAQARAESTITVLAPVAVAVTIAPRTTSVVASGTVAFTATVANASDTAVTWSVPGTGCGTITQAGVYTAPATARTCSVVATSRADPTRSDTATVTVAAPPPPVTIAISPSSGTVNTCRTLTFTATVTGATDTAATWRVQEGAAGGTITTAGVYTAPENSGTYHVVGTSRADPSRTAVATVTVTDRILSVAVAPQQVTLAPGGTAQLTATVTTTCGSYTTNTTLSAAEVGAVGQ
jgi:hypothetical protein